MCIRDSAEVDCEEAGRHREDSTDAATTTRCDGAGRATAAPRGDGATKFDKKLFLIAVSVAKNKA